MVDDGKIEIIKPEMIPLDRLHPNPTPLGDCSSRDTF